MTFDDPDGNGWVLQEITTRFPGRIDTGATRYGSVTDLAEACRARGRGPRGEHEKEVGGADPSWPDWYAGHVAAEQSGVG